MVLASAPATEPAPTAIDPADTGVLTLSADSPESLRHNALQLAHDIENSDAPLAQLCWSTNRIKASGKARLAIVTGDRAEAVAALRGDFETGTAAGMSTGWLFSGQGTQYPGMATALYESSEAFRDAFDRGRRGDGATPRCANPRGHGRRSHQSHRVRPARDLRAAVCAGTSTTSARCRTGLAARSQHWRVRRGRDRRGVQPRRRLPAGRRPRPSHAAAAGGRRHARGPCDCRTTSPDSPSISRR